MSRPDSATKPITYILQGRDREARTTLNGIFSEAEIKAEIKTFSAVRKKLSKGEAVGHLIFN
ncbi:hypothetical protein HOY34_21635 [Xinfangfangia sp. D13-10-4-6]|uniref:hypothetical protein n=1 Tax=Pseudogemmobacter hezensis TaxID=2737662 RepID=UPI00155678D7|nr:hypothetical protein [Pseudogemmobacter hezensis]NPD17772.1 hypothetical protein [Pseudogemmobacter hezensis]